MLREVAAVAVALARVALAAVVAEIIGPAVLREVAAVAVAVARIALETHLTRAVRTADGKLEVTSVYLAPSSCYSAGPTTPGAPADVIAVDNAVLITQQLKHSGDQMCLWMMKSVAARALAIPNP